MGIFNKEEKAVLSAFKTKFQNEEILFNQLLEVYASFLQITSGKVKDNEYPNWTLLILLSQTLPLMDNAFYLLSSGYIRSSEIMIRVVAEAVILSAYFKEFPDAEIEYRTTNYRDFFKNHKIENMLKRVEKDGKVFISDKQKAKQVKWHKIVFLNLFKEPSRFLHNNPNVIYDITKNNIRASRNNHELIMGPQLYSDDILKMGLRRLFNTLLFSLVVLGVSLNIFPDDNEKSVMEQSQKLIEKLNVAFTKI